MRVPGSKCAFQGSSLKCKARSLIRPYLPGTESERTAFTGSKLEAQSMYQDQSVRTGIKLEAQSVYQDQSVRTGIKLEAQSAYRDQA